MLRGKKKKKIDDIVKQEMTAQAIDQRARIAELSVSTHTQLKAETVY
jgi:hypothetical protein